MPQDPVSYARTLERDRDVIDRIAALAPNPQDQARPTSPRSRPVQDNTTDVVLGAVTVLVGVACISIGILRWHAVAPLWSYGAALATVGMLLIRAGRR